MLLASAVFTPDFLNDHQLGVELYIPADADEKKWEFYCELVRTIHLPYSDLNLAACDENERRSSIETVKTAVRRALRFNARTMVLHPCGVFSFQGQEVGEYAFLIESLREIAGFMADNGLILSLENQVLRHPDLRIIAACSSDEWFQLYKDVNCGNVTLTLDTSHAASAVAHEPTAEERFRKLQDFLSHPEWVTHFHWSDARLTTDEAKWSDMHLVPGTGDLPLDFHRAIKQHGGSILFEQNCSEAELEAGLRFYESL